jgi:hypothetical protein
LRILERAQGIRVVLDQCIHRALRDVGELRRECLARVAHERQIRQPVLMRDCDA